MNASKTALRLPVSEHSCLVTGEPGALCIPKLTDGCTRDELLGRFDQTLFSSHDPCLVPTRSYSWLIMDRASGGYGVSCVKDGR